MIQSNQVIGIFCGSPLVCLCGYVCHSDSCSDTNSSLTRTIIHISMRYHYFDAPARVGKLHSSCGSGQVKNNRSSGKSAALRCTARTLSHCLARILGLKSKTFSWFLWILFLLNLHICASLYVQTNSKIENTSHGNHTRRFTWHVTMQLTNSNTKLII